MNITIIGASAGVGLATVKRALELGHRVTTLARRKVEIEPNENLTEIQGSALNEEDLKRAISGADAVLVTLGTNNQIGATTLFSDFAKALLSLHSQEPIVAPVITLTGFGSGESRPYLAWYYRGALDLMLGRVYADKALMERMITASTLRWEFTLAWFLTNGPLTERYSIETNLYLGMKLSKISRLDIADYLVKESVAQANLGKYVAVSGK